LKREWAQSPLAQTRNFRQLNAFLQPGAGAEKLKLWALYCDEGEDRLKLSSSAGFALLTEDGAACSRFLDEIGCWPELFKEIIQAENPEVQRRCIMAIANITEKSEANASKIMAVSFLCT
jgi:hypothetical protein